MLTSGAPAWLNQFADRGPDPNLYAKTFRQTEGIHTLMHTRALVVQAPDGRRYAFASVENRGAPYEVHQAVVARLAEAGGLELRIFTRDGKKILATRRPDPAAHPDGNHDLMLQFMNDKPGGPWASIPVAVFYTRDFRELHRYIEYPAIYHKDRIRGHQQASRPGETDAQAKERAQREFVAMQTSPFFAGWASAAVDEILSALYETLTLDAGAPS